MCVSSKKIFIYSGETKNSIIFGNKEQGQLMIRWKDIPLGIQIELLLHFSTKYVSSRYSIFFSVLHPVYFKDILLEKTTHLKNATLNIDTYQFIIFWIGQYLSKDEATVYKTITTSELIIKVANIYTPSS